MEKSALKLKIESLQLDVELKKQRLQIAKSQNAQLKMDKYQFKSTDNKLLKGVKVIALIYGLNSPIEKEELIDILKCAINVIE
jgi:hypothetical protein